MTPQEVGDGADGRAETLMTGASRRLVDGSAKGSIADEVGNWSTEGPQDGHPMRVGGQVGGSPEDSYRTGPAKSSMMETPETARFLAFSFSVAPKAELSGVSEATLPCPAFSDLVLSRKLIV